MGFENDAQPKNIIEKEKIPPPPTFLNSLEESLAGLNPVQQRQLPLNYLEIQKSFINKEIISSKESLTLFHGGPMKWERFGIKDGWLITACYAYQDEDGGEHHLDFHILSINCDHGRDFADAVVEINAATDDELKLSSYNTDGQNRDLKDSIVNMTVVGEKKVIIRPVLCGNLSYPLISSAENCSQLQTENIVNGLKMIGKSLQLSLPHEESLNDFGANIIKKNEFKVAKDLDESRQMGETILHKTELGDIYSTEIISPHSTWKSFIIYSATPLNEINTSNAVNIRLDSTCICMDYINHSCDCHSQLLSALKDMIDHQGIIIHFPTQDGRGYGTNSKMNSECYKNGFDPVSGKAIDKMSSIEIAELTYGETYDIRSYSEVGEILSLLGIKKVTILTDNLLKIWSVTRALGAENVTQSSTDTIDQMIEANVDLDILIQIFLKMYSDKKYQANEDYLLLTLHKIFIYGKIKYDRDSTLLEGVTLLQKVLRLI